MQSGSDGVRTRGHLVKSQVLYLTKLQTQPCDPPTLYERDGINSSRLGIKILPAGKESRSSQSTIGFLEYANPRFSREINRIAHIVEKSDLRHPSTIQQGSLQGDRVGNSCSGVTI